MRKHIEQSSLLGGNLYSASSCNSAARFWHAFLWWGRCEVWQSLPQYFTILHAAHRFSLMSSCSSWPQLAHNAGSSFLLSAGVLMVSKAGGKWGGEGRRREESEEVLFGVWLPFESYYFHIELTGTMKAQDLLVILRYLLEDEPANNPPYHQLLHA